MRADTIAAIRKLRAAAHDLENACAAFTGGVSMAISKPSVADLAKTTRGLTPRALPENKE